MFDPTVYAITELRGRNCATNTISSALRGIQCFYLYLELRGIDLKERLEAGQFLSLGEVEDLAGLCRLPIQTLEKLKEDSAQTGTIRNVISFEKVRVRLSDHTDDEVNPAVTGTRIRCIRDYLAWLARGAVTRQNWDKGANNEAVNRLNGSLDRVLSSFTSRIPKHTSSKAIGEREGLAPNEISELLRVVSPESPDNPWQNDYTKYRNHLIVHWLYSLGLRRGELLGVRVSDIDFQKGTVTIHRRADDPSDPRANQPQAKTRAREIPLSDGLIAMTYSYVMNRRSLLKRAKKHNFLFCAAHTGEPLSLPSLNKIFRVLRTYCSALPTSLCPHVLRHTWNDRFSEEMDKRQAGEDTEKKLRSYLMGWGETSGTAAVYTRRHVRKKAQEASLKMQETIMGSGQTNE